MMRLHLRKQIYMEGGYMLSSIEVTLIWVFIIILAFTIGKELIKLMMVYIDCKRKEWRL